MNIRLSAVGLEKSFGATSALKGVSLEAAAGEVHAIVGENGAGKSTLMRLIGGELTSDAGYMMLEGDRYEPKGPAGARSRGIAVVSQELAVCPHMTLAENVMLGQELTRYGILHRSAMYEQVIRVMDELTGGTRPEWLRLDAPVRDLSMAACQIVEIARALIRAGGCKVLILDEPTSSLGKADTERLFAVIRKLCKSGVTVLYVSHFLEEVSSIADRFTVLRDGETVGSGNMASTAISDVVRMMVGRTIEQMFVHRQHVVGDAILEVEDLAGPSKPKRASLKLHRGEVLGIAGLVGAGRSELLRTIFGLDKVRRGVVRVGTMIGPTSPVRWLASGMGMLSEDRKGEGLAASMSIAENLTLSKPVTHRIPGVLSLEQEREATANWIERMRIKARDPGQRVMELSGGNQQKVALARLLHHGVDVFLLDEPTRGIDVGSKAHIYELIDELATQGKAILITSSYLPELLGICDRIQVMSRGELGDSRPVSEWSADRLLEEATGVST